MAYASTRSAASDLRLCLLVLEGYLYLLGTILVFAGVATFLAWGVFARNPLLALLALFLGVPTVMLTGAAIRALVFRVPEPHGVEVTAEQAPALFSSIERARHALGAPRIHRVLIGPAFNASACQVPRLAIFRPRNTLVIGYPLLVTLTPEQLDAVIAHELAHLFHAHGRVSGWVYRTRLSWMRLAAALNERGTLPIFVRWLLATYVPRLQRRSAEIARAQELLADRRSAEFAGTRAAADALVASEIVGNKIAGLYWSAVFDDLAPDEEARPFSRMRDGLGRLAGSEDRAALLDGAMESATRSSDTHPCLRERLQAIGEAAQLPPLPERLAGQAYLSDFLDLAATRLDRDWQQTHGEGWRERQAELRDAHARLAQLDAEPALSAEEDFERGTLLEILGREDEALAAYRSAMEGDAGHACAMLAAGRLLLAREEKGGSELIEKAMEIEEGLVPKACALLVQLHQRDGRLAEAERFRARATRHATRMEFARSERTQPTALDHFVPHELAASALRPLLAALKRDPHVKAAFLVRKRLRHSEGSQLVLALAVESGDAAALSQRIDGLGLLDADACIHVLDRGEGALRSAVEAVPGARIHSR